MQQDSIMVIICIATLRNCDVILSLDLSQLKSGNIINTDCLFTPENERLSYYERIFLNKSNYRAKIGSLT